MNENEIIIKCLQGNPLAQRSLYERFAGKMYGVCLRYARDGAEAQDMLQDGFVRVFRYLEKYEGKGSFEGWIRRIVVNVALRHIEVSKIKYETSYENMPEVATQPSVLPALSAEEMLGYLRRLPKGYRTVFNLYALEDYSHAEIATELGIKESTSRSQLLKARLMLQEIILTENKINVS